ncbi:hypothetical protein J1N35_011151 [Gossypium stocksii]|uniref:Uncharacterized protein n=1 Tax=Gossypium stocksii TaxID=47602 RepID=A0A9D4ACX9_9ROSI|nr:hypothetical protein J1N35_011151 [Gossypium stocksii]
MGLLQHELAQMQLEVSQIDTKIDTRLKDFRENLKGEIRTERRSLFEQYFGQQASTSVAGGAQDKGKGILGGTPPRFPPKEPLALSSASDLANIPSRVEGEGGRSGTLKRQRLRMFCLLCKMTRFVTAVLTVVVCLRSCYPP